MKILINVPNLKFKGGVSNHFNGLKNHWTIKVNYNIVGNRRGLPGIVCILYDIPKFMFLCIFGKYDCVMLNPSLDYTAVKRDALYLKIAKLFKKKVIVFFHGWNHSFSEKIDCKPEIFRNKFYKSDLILVLAKDFKKKIEKWGYDGKVFLTTTKVNNNLLVNFDINKKQYNQKIIFLARLELEKGILLTLEIFKHISKEFPLAQLIVVGDGIALASSKKFVFKEKISNVTFLGSLSGNKVSKAFESASIYILPTTHGEGMPTTVLEAMAFGLPIISRPVGGLPDFFVEEKMGYLISSLIPEEYIQKIKILLKNPEKQKNMGIYNHLFAIDNFLASKVCLKLEKIIIDKL